jgi:hypothetical protein
MNIDFSDFLGALEDDIWLEKPVDLNTFLYDKQYLGLNIVLSPLQFEIVQRGSQVLNRETLEALYPDDIDFIKPYSREIILPLGKSSGKDLLSQLICCYIVYQLLCLKDPAGYYGKPMGDNIDIVNVAINAKQANNVFFSGLKTRIKLCPWFQGKYTPRQSDIEFQHNIRIHSLNSEGEGTEGLNILVAVLDEIDGFDEADPECPKGNAMYKTLRGTVASRFERNGKVLLLSFPRRKDGFILKHYNESIAEKEVIVRSYTFKLDEDLPDGTPGNEFDISWEEDHIISYKFSHVWAIKRATWEVNPEKTPDTFKMEFYHDPDDALARFAAAPTDAADGGWYKNKQRIDEVFSKMNGIDVVTGHSEFIIKPNPDKLYFAHVDLARVQDNCAVAIAHVEHFKKAMYDLEDKISPYVVVDVVKYWKPDRTRPIDFADVREFIISAKRAGFNIKLVTFDRWNSDLTIEHLNSVAIPADKLSVDQHTYSELALLMGQQMVEGPDVELLRDELKKLVVLPNGKVDHTNKSSKDLSDAVAGAVYNASIHTPRDMGDLEVMTYADIIKANREAGQKPSRNAIDPPKMPKEIEDFLSSVTIF